SMRAACAVLLCVAAGCAQRLERRLVEPGKAATLDRESPFLKIHLRDGGVYILSQWRVDEPGAAVEGEGELQDRNRATVRQGNFRVPLAQVALFETNVVHVSALVAPLAVISVLSLVGTLACAEHPKSCFGSCPTFYASDG